MKLFAFTCGWLTGPTGLFLDGEHGTIRMPVPAFLVRHPQGDVLFDTGLHPDVAHDAKGRLGFLADVFATELGTDDVVGARLAALEVAPERLRHVVLSHLHFDHAGGLASLPNARITVQRRDWEAGHDADLAGALSFARQDFDHGHDVQLIDGEHDLFGDGRIVCLPTHGHTPGHQSLRVRLDSGDVVLTADACYLRRTLETDHLPPSPFDRAAMLASLRRLRALRDAGARVVFGHDAEAWASVPAEME
ncbi:N-acyl homoserine lactonase family protein [Candidatus Binatia bacterium]|nr:N-acyl homoserine lactonase family protein [Candidatus Binatia bacterium]